MHVPPSPTVVLLVTRLLTPYRPIPSPPQTASPPTPHWTIHRPRSGWYLALRPSHPTPSTASTLGSSGFVPLEPLRTRSRSTIGTQLAFALRLPPSSSLTSTSTSPKANTPSPSVEITIPPLDSAGVHPAADGGGAVARFVLRGLPPAAREVGWWGAVKAGGAGLRDAIWGAPRVGWGCYAVLREGEEEVMRWEDTTSTFATSTAGLLHLAERLPSLPGIDQAFWVAVALAYIDFTDDQDAYLAAAQGD